MPLERTLSERLATPGGLTVAELMAAAADHYERHAVIGAAGDFTTAPEISQVFGELLGIWLAEAWLRQGRPDNSLLVELGPGRGTLIADLWQTLRVVPGCRDALDVHLVERSERLRAQQRAALTDADVVPVFHDVVHTLPDRPLLLVANEFLDALPAHQLVRRASGWLERAVVRAADGPRWTEQPAPPDLAAAAERATTAATAGAIVEIAPLRSAVVAEVAARIRRFGGAALFIDYGGFGAATGDTLQAVRAHAAVDVLSTLGTADLSTAVAFGPLVEVARDAGCTVVGPIPQGAFLRALGLEVRALKLAHAQARAEDRAAVFAAARRLSDADAMGELFKVLAILPDGMADTWAVPA